MDRNEAYGSLGIVYKNPRHVHGDGDDGTTTRWEKACAMSDKINLPLAHKSMRRHDHARTRIIVGIVCVAVVLVLALRWAWRVSYGL
jgi:hypothetical protein